MDGYGNGSLFVTVDGDEAAMTRVRKVVYDVTESVFRVGQPWIRTEPGGPKRELNMRHMDGTPVRLGVAANKNTGLELMMDNTPAVNLFLSDDDSWPKSSTALVDHIDSPLAHSMVCWGRHRRSFVQSGFASWQWPRGAVLYVRRSVVEAAGGMVEEFGAGGHEHVEWSKRIHRLGLTPVEFPSPRSNADHNYMGAMRLWNCEDMPKPGESVRSTMTRRGHLTSIRRTDQTEEHIDKIMKQMEGSTAYVPYHAADNGRASATL